MSLRDEADAERFERHRHHRALLGVEADSPEPPPGRLTALVAGAVLALAILMCYLVL